MVSVDGVVVEELDAASTDFVSHTQIVERLTAAAQGLDPASYDRRHMDAVRAAFCFRRATDGAFHGDFRGDEADPWPSSLREIPADVPPIWEAYAAGAASPAVRAHLRHLLVGARHAPVHEHARSAISEYRAAVPVFLAASEPIPGRARAGDALIEALGLAAGMNQAALRDLVAKDMLDLAERFIDDPDPALGLAHELLEALRRWRLEDAAVRGLIERAVTRSADDVHLQVMFLKLLRGMDADPATQRPVDTRIVTTMLDAVQHQPNKMLQLLLLNDAATAARNAGLGTLHDDAISKIQAMNTSDLGMAQVSGTFQFPAEILTAAVAEIDAAGSLAEALWKIARGPIPSGRIAVAEQAARLLVSSAPFASMVPRGRINPGGPVPVAPASGDALANMQARYQVLCMSTAGVTITAQLDQIAERFTPGEQDLFAVFDHRLLGSPSKTRMLVHAFQHFWAGQDDASVHLVLPRIEDLLREIERDRGVSILSVAQGASPGGLSQLGTLISAMPDAGFDADRTRYLHLLLTDGVHGLNLRNDIGHGLIDCPPRNHVALALHAALFLLAVAHGETSTSAQTASASDAPLTEQPASAAPDSEQGGVPVAESDQQDEAQPQAGGDIVSEVQE